MTPKRKATVIALATLSALLLIGSFALPFVSNTFDVALTGQDYRGLLASVEETLAQSAKRKRPTTVMDALAQSFRDYVGQQVESDITRRLSDPQVVARLNAALKAYAIERGGVQEGEHYLGRMILDLFAGGEWLIGIAVVLFSVAFPIAKILGVLWVAAGAIPEARRTAVAHVIDRLSKWSAGDVFLVALAIVFFKAKGFNYQFHAEWGVACYLLAFVASAVASALLLRPEAVRPYAVGPEPQPD